MHASLFLLLPVLASLHQPAAAANGTTQDAGCPPATCRNLTLAYPFWLAGQDRFSCGPPAFRLTCNDSAAGAFLSTSYMKVLNIDYGSRSLVVVHALLAADAACTIMFNVSSAFAITDRFSISRRNRELYVLSSCKERRPPPEAIPVTNCRANSSGMYVYLGGNYGTGQPPVNEGSCDTSIFPVLRADPAGMMAANYRQLIKGGFLLEWEPSAIAMPARRAVGGAATMPAHQRSRAFAQTVACTRPLVMNPESRPSMSKVIEMLERNMGELEMPPRPFLCSPVHSTTVSSYASVQVMMSSP